MNILNEAVYHFIRENKEIVSADPYRLHYHLMPPVGLLNDPNGFVYYQGKYHIFFQWNPFETKHGRKYWGHYCSDDLVHWEALPIALAPDEWYDKDGCYSGSAVVKDGKLLLFYTGNVKNSGGKRETYQCLAISEDGITFEKKGPIIYLPEGYTAHFRDPKVFFKNGRWYMVIGAQTVNKQGEVVLYTSSDIENWTFCGALAGSSRNGLGDFGYMWECPDLFTLNSRDILIMSPQGLEADGYKYNNLFQSGYLSGKVDYEKTSYDHGEFQELDRGFDFYAPQTTEDPQGRRLLFAWMGNAEPAESQQPTVKHKWIHALTLPRTLEFKDGKLFQQPVEELTRLRKNRVSYHHVNLENEKIQLENILGNVVEMEVSLKKNENSTFSITFGKSKLSYDPDAALFSFQRMRFDKQGMESRHCTLSELRHLRIYKDSSSLEIFINHGEEVFTSRIFDEIGATEITFQANGLICFDVNKWDLGSK